MNALQSELLKYKRTFMGKLIVFFPVSFAAYAFIMQSTLMQNPLSQTTSWAWQSLLALIFNWWSFLFLPIGFALFATLVAFQEKKAGNYRALRTHNVSPMTLWINKVIAMAVYSFISTLVLIVVTIITGLILKAGPVPFWTDYRGKYCMLGCFSCYTSTSAMASYMERYVPKYGSWSFRYDIWCPCCDKTILDCSTLELGS